MLLVSACTSYEPVPLDGAAIVAAIAGERELPDPTVATPKLSDATRWMLAHGPTVQEAFAAYRTARARSDIATPWPDPTIEFGPQFASGDDVDASRSVTPFVALAIPIPLGGRLGAQDDLNRARTEARRIEAIVALRDEYLGLRSDWATLSAARSRQQVIGEIADAFGRTADAARRLIEAGGATALDAALFELDFVRAENARIEATLEANAAAGALSARTGVGMDRFVGFDRTSLPKPPEQVPPIDALRTLLAWQRRGLVGLRAEYVIAERALRLEVEKQYPDLVLWPGFSDEPGESREVFKLGVGLRLPIFDRNQQAIAEAEQRREELRTRYEAAVRRGLAELDEHRLAVELATARRRGLEERVLPRAEQNLDLARRSAMAGAIDALRLLDAERSLAQLRVDLLDAELREILAWVALERVVGHPLIEFPGEPPIPGSPPDASESADAGTLDQIMGEHDREGEGEGIER